MLGRLARALWTSLALGACATGCQFDAAPAKGKVVICSAESPSCPSGMECNTDVGVCVKKGSVGLSPMLTATPRRAAVKLGDHLSIDVRSSKPLVKPPALFINVGLRRKDLTLELAADDSQDFVFGMVATSADPEGLYALFVDAIDRDGFQLNGASTQGVFAIDNTPPRVLLDRSAIVPRVVKPGGVINVTAVLSEPVAPGAQFTGRLRGTNATLGSFTADQETANINTYSVVIPLDAPNGEWDVALDAMTDLAGNAALPTQTALGTLSVDSLAPTIEPFGLSGRHFSTQSGHSTVTVPIGVDGGADTVEVCFAFRCVSLDAGVTQVQFDVRDTDAEGPATIDLTAVDLARNSARHSESVVLDFTPPDILGDPLIELVPPAGCPLAQVSALTTGAKLRAFFTVNEPLEAPPTVWLADAGLSRTNDAGTQFRFELVGTDTLPNGPQLISVRAVDVVGNARTTTLHAEGSPSPLAVPIDTVAPVIPSAARLSEALVTRIPWGSNATQGATSLAVWADAGVFEPGATLFFYDAANTNTAEFLGTAVATSSGAVAQTKLRPTDLLTVYATQFDAACNRDSTLATGFTHGEWVATVGKRKLGNPRSNPNELRTAISETLRERLGSLPREVVDAGELNDGARVLSSGNYVVMEPAGAHIDAFDWSSLEVWDPYDKELVLLPRLDNVPPTAFIGSWTGSQLQSHLIPASEFPRIATASFQGYFDRTLQRTVFLNQNNRSEFDVLTWNGVRLQVLPTTNSPPSRGGAGLAWDGVNQVALLFGGVGTQPLNDTWVFNGSSWTQRSPMTSPSPRAGHAMVWDPQRNKVVLFGGGDLVAAPLDDTWEWNGTNWQELAVGSTRPPGRGVPVLTFDSFRNRIVLAGGAVQRNGFWVDSEDTWELSGTTWTRVASGFSAPYCPTVPGVTSIQAWSPTTGDFDEVRKKTVLICSQLVWEWDGNTWEYHGTLRGRDTLTTETQMSAYDFTNQRLLSVPENGRELFARGKEIGHLNNAGTPPRIRCLTWAGPLGLVALYRDDSNGNAGTGAWNGTNWTSTPVPFQVRDRCSLAYDRVRNRVVMYLSGNQQTWEWDGASWAMPTLSGPAPRDRYGEPLLHYDTVKHVVVMFSGGGDDTSPSSNDVWEWDGSTWTERLTTNAPVNMTSADKQGAFDENRGVYVLMARHRAGYLPHLYELNDTVWTEVTPWVSNAFPMGGNLAYDTRLKLVRWHPYPGEALSFGWGADGLHRLRSSRFQPPSFNAVVSYDPDRDRVVLFGEGETWEWDRTTWVNKTDWTLPTPADRAFHAMAYDPVGHRTLLTGGGPTQRIWGNEYDTVFDDTWSWNGTAWTRLTSAGSTASARLGPNIVWNSDDNALVMVGGANDAGIPAVKWNGASWVSAGTVPPQVATSSNMAGAYNESTHEHWLISGYHFTNGTSQSCSNVYGAISAGAWADHTSPYSNFGPCITLPAVVYDADRKKVVVPVGALDDGEGTQWWAEMGDSYTLLAPILGLPAHYLSVAGFIGFPGVGNSYTVDRARGSYLSYQSPGAITDYGSPPAVVPVHEFSVDGTAAVLPAGATVNRIDVEFWSGASGVGSSGANVQQWNGVAWSTASSNTATDTSPGQLTMNFTSPPAVDAQWKRQPMVFRVAPRSPNAPQLPVKLATDSVEVRVRYTLP